MTRTRTPLWCSSARSCRMNRRNSAISSRTSDGGLVQFSALKEKMVRNPMPRSPAARTVRRSASTPRRCPSPLGNPRAAAQRPFPSMIMATCRGTARLAMRTARSGSAWDILYQSLHREHFFFLGRKQSVDLRHCLVRRLLHLLGRSLSVVFADFVILLELFEHIQSVASDVTHRHPGSLGVFVRHFYELAPALLVQLRNTQAQNLTFRRRS